MSTRRNTRHAWGNSKAAAVALVCSTNLIGDAWGLAAVAMFVAVVTPATSTVTPGTVAAVMVEVAAAVPVVADVSNRASACCSTAVADRVAVARALAA